MAVSASGWVEYTQDTSSDMAKWTTWLRPNRPVLYWVTSRLAGELASRNTSPSFGITRSMSIRSIITGERMGTRSLSLPLDLRTFNHFNRFLPTRLVSCLCTVVASASWSASMSASLLSTPN